MSRPALPFDLPLERLRVRAWHDPVVEAVGHDLRSPYVERFWLALLGPSTTLLLRRLAGELEAAPDGFDLDLEETARAIGLGMRGGAGGPFLRAIARTGQFHLSRADGPGAMAIRTRISDLTRHQVERLPESLRAEHDEWVARAAAIPTPDERRTRARLLALSLLELGEPPEAAEVQLHRWKFHPAMAHEAMRWALARVGRPAARPASGGSSVPPIATAADAARPSPTGPRSVPTHLRPRPSPPPPGDAA